MITIQLYDYEFLDLLMDRLEYWVDDEDIKSLYRDYYESLINSGCFENVTMSIFELVDNDYINYTDVCTLEELKDNYNIEDVENNDKILMSNYDNTLFLVQRY